jgi:hypothetical protein
VLGLRFAVPLVVEAAQCPANDVLPWQLMHQLIQSKGDFEFREGVAVRIQEANVGDQPEGVRHGNDAIVNLDPVPGDACRSRFAPEGLTAAWRLVVAERQHLRAKMSEMQSGRFAGLPQ